MVPASRGITRFVPKCLLGMISAVILCPLSAEETAPPADLAEKIRAIFPGITIDAKDRRVDVEAVICLTEGFLEVVACSKNTKEHESLVAVEAKPSHMHAALLLIGAKNGNPAMSKPLDKEGNRWQHFPPRGQPIKVSLVIPKEGGGTEEKPIGDFVTTREDESGLGEAAHGKGKFPEVFLFTGSQFEGEGKDRIYLADSSGHVASISTFGDELLALAGIHGQDNEALDWQVNPETVPELGTKVILRLRPLAVANGGE